MKLKTEPGAFQQVVFMLWLCLYAFICHAIQERIDDADLFGVTVAVIYVLLVAAALLVSRILQFAFGLPWLYGDTNKACASSFRWLDEYQPSTMRISSISYSGKYEVELKLVLDAEELDFLDSTCPRSGLNYFRFFEGYFPFDEKRKTKLYLTRAALRQIRRAIKNIDDDADEKASYVQLKFELKVPYFGRDLSLFDKWSYLLSRWDINELEWLAKKQKELNFGDLTLSPEDLAEYRGRLENSELDTFIKVASEPEEK